MISTETGLASRYRRTILHDITCLSLKQSENLCNAKGWRIILSIALEKHCALQYHLPRYRSEITAHLLNMSEFTCCYSLDSILLEAGVDHHYPYPIASSILKSHSQISILVSKSKSVISLSSVFSSHVSPTNKLSFTCRFWVDVWIVGGAGTEMEVVGVFSGR